MNSEIGSREKSLVDLHVQEVIRSAELELLALLQQRTELMKRIGSIKQTLVGLANMFGDSVLSEQLLDLLDRNTARRSGFTQACRAVLMESSTHLSARQVCDLLQKKFPGVLARHKKPLASVTTVLARLAEYDEVRTFLDEDGRRLWQWSREGSFLPGPREMERFGGGVRNSA